MPSHGPRAAHAVRMLRPMSPFWPAELQPTEPLDAHAGRFPSLRSLTEQDFKHRHFHGPVRRLARDTPDRLWPLPRLLFGSSCQGQRERSPRVPLRNNLRVSPRGSVVRRHPGLAAGLHAAAPRVLTIGFARTCPSAPLAANARSQLRKPHPDGAATLRKARP